MCCVEAPAAPSPSARRPGSCVHRGDGDVDSDAAVIGRRRARVTRPSAATCGNHNGVFLPSLNEYSVKGGSFISPLGSKTIVVVTPLKLDLANSFRYTLGSTDLARFIASTSNIVAS